MFLEPHPDVVTPQPGGHDDPLGESVLDAAGASLRVFTPREVRIVLGRSQDPAREIDLAAARADGIPIHRRVAGGGCVVLAPGMVVVAVRLAPGAKDPNAYFAQVNAALVPAIAAVAGLAPSCRGHGDLTLPGEDGHPRKILGTSLRQTAQRVIYLGVLLVENAVPLMERYLTFPSKQPDYRLGRGHRAFCTHLGRHGVTVPALIAALTPALAAIADTPPGGATCPTPSGIA